MLTLVQAQAVLVRLDSDAKATLASTQARVRNNSGLVRGIMTIFDGDPNSQLQASVGAVRIIQGSIDRLRADVPAAVADPDRGDRWANTAREAQNSLKMIDGYQAVATIDAVLSQTFTATVTTVRDGAAKLGAGVASLVPGWAWAVIALAVGGGLYLKTRRGA
jgi:hypothetical protein